MNEREQDQIRSAVRKEYGAVASSSVKGTCSPGCCGANPEATLGLGYPSDDLAAVPDGANMGLGCGNPHAIAALKAGETVLDLGAGGGFDCFLAANRVGDDGRVIGVDMTPEMITKARTNAAKVGTKNVEFRLGEIEHLPVADATVDVILSNCVINLSPDKASAFREAFRVLKPGGRLAISDVVAVKAVPEAVSRDVSAIASCLGGATGVDALTELLDGAGFRDIRIQVNEQSRAFIKDWLPGSGAEEYVASATVEAVKPNEKSCCGPSCCAPGSAA